MKDIAERELGILSIADGAEQVKFFHGILCARALSIRTADSVSCAMHKLI